MDNLQQSLRDLTVKVKRELGVGTYEKNDLTDQLVEMVTDLTKRVCNKTVVCLGCGSLSHWEIKLDTDPKTTPANWSSDIQQMLNSQRFQSWVRLFHSNTKAAPTAPCVLIQQRPYTEEYVIFGLSYQQAMMTDLYHLARNLQMVNQESQMVVLLRVPNTDIYISLILSFTCVGFMTCTTKTPPSQKSRSVSVEYGPPNPVVVQTPAGSFRCEGCREIKSLDVLVVCSCVAEHPFQKKHSYCSQSCLDNNHKNITMIKGITEAQWRHIRNNLHTDQYQLGLQPSRRRLRKEIQNEPGSALASQEERCRLCSVCAKWQKVSQFSKNQWNKRAKERKCVECTLLLDDGMLIMGGCILPRN